ncbi:MAG: phenylacetate--CoA ligase family protein [Granulosicoccus sp.]|nr:phenylacetate--CoA ligase family protein [Granulosicoccus sp.]
MDNRVSEGIRAPLTSLADWADGMRCWQAVHQLHCAPTVSAAAARNTGRRRASELIRHACRHSPFYRRHFAGVAPGSALDAYPPVTRAQLMANFDDWATDRRISDEAIRQFLSTKDNIGGRFLDEYLVWTSSGTTGEPGIFVQDRDALSLYQSLLYVRYQHNNPASLIPDPWHLAYGASRMALVAALEGHFAGTVFWQWASRLNPWLASRTRTFSILQPVNTLVEQLNDWQADFLSSYPSMLLLLAEEQERGRLRLSLNSLWSGGERLTEQQRRRIQSAFGCTVIEDYGASEAMNMAFGCQRGRLHVNADWFILEPVDEHLQAVPAGEKSATTLVTNLANRVQPLIRYDLGDSTVMHTDACDCGNPLPTLSVAGRDDDTLWLAAGEEGTVPVLPLALNTVIEEYAGEFGFQIIQTSRGSLDIRTPGDSAAARRCAFDRICEPLQRYLASIGATSVVLRQDPTPPQREAVSGKLRQVSNRFTESCGSPATG